MKIAICDSDNKSAEALKKILGSYNREFRELEIYSYSSGEDLVSAYKKKGIRFNMIFLETILGKLDGIETVKIISEIDSNVLIFFVTGSMEYVFLGYEVKAFRYIMKPFTEEEIKRAYNSAIKELFKNEKRYSVQTKSRLITINIDNLLYLESVKRQVFAITVNDRIGFYSKLINEEERLKSFGFVRVHQGFLVNMTHIKTIVEGDIILTNGDVIPISKSRKKAAFMHYTKYLTEYSGI